VGDYCPCGRPLHYNDPLVERAMRNQIAQFGPNVERHYQGRTWLVPRHYAALHEIKLEDLPALAQELGFTEVMPDDPT
jgi:hypothetical protein